MSDIWVFGATALGVLMIVSVAVWCWPTRIPRGRSVDEIRQRIEDEDDRTRQ
ncbi:hypothetical protein [Nocardia cerradoensis]|uniref:hypothetical protein n=1 Tax=Nocardia cerradoensis TaxID=85688 RepID=UPI0002ED16C9|nr:hypothetical protein [Nocardia cerradoensis]NKY48268.1 hypothetical protein [Nocardia cerradoensis]